MTTKARSTHGPKGGHPVKKRKARVISGLSRTALTDALGAPQGYVRVKHGHQVKPGTLLVSNKSGLKSKRFLLRDYDVEGAKPVNAVVGSGIKVFQRNKPEANITAIAENKPIAERLRLLGAQPGSRLEGELVVKVLSSIRAGAEQITGSSATAGELLSNTNFDGTGMTAEELVREGRASRVLSRLDDLRYGSRG